MSYPGVTLAIVLGVALGTAIYCYFKSDNSRQAHSGQAYTYDSDSDNGYREPASNSFQEGTDTHPSAKRRKNCKRCPICLDKLEKSTTKRIDCGHAFHDICITMWFRTSRTCPNCRSEASI